MPGDGAHLREPEPEAIPDACRDTVLVKSSRQAHGIGKTTAKQHLLQAQVPPLQISRQPLQHRGYPGPASPQTGLPQGRQRSAR